MTAGTSLSSSLEDYLEAIYLQGLAGVPVRPKELITRLGVTGPSVTEALHVLTEKKLINYIPYGPITLTSNGETAAREIYHRHETLKRFFIEILGVEEELAEESACKLEHSTSTNLIRRLVLYTRFAREDLGSGQLGVAERFQQYLQQQKRCAPPEKGPAS